MGGRRLLKRDSLGMHTEPSTATKRLSTHDLTTSGLRALGWLGVYLNASGLLGLQGHNHVGTLKLGAMGMQMGACFCFHLDFTFSALLSGSLILTRILALPHL